MKRIILIILVIILTLTTFTGCIARMRLSKNIDNLPLKRPNTTWVSEDGSIVFTVFETGLATGTMTVEDETIEIYITCYQTYGMLIYPISVAVDGVTKPNLHFECWSNYYASEDAYIAKVSSETTYFEKGQNIIFIRVDDNG